MDVGCNRGYYISQYRNGTSIGIDIAFSVLNQARKRLPKTNLIQADAQNLAFLKSNSIDSILCSEVIEHVTAPHRVISECFRVLKPGGRILLTTPNYKRNKPTWIEVGNMKSYGVKGVNGDCYFHTAFRPEELQAMALQTGFEVLKAGTFEKEVKYATRIPVLFYHPMRILNERLTGSKKIARLNDKMLENASLFIFKLCNLLGINNLLKMLVREGVRTYLFATKRFRDL